MRPLAALVPALALCAPTAALACGAIFSPVESSAGAAFETQTVLVHRAADRIDLHVRMTVAPGAETFSWVLPAPADAELRLGDDALFEALDGMTRPFVDLEYVGSNGGCSPGDSAGAAGGSDGVDVVETGRIGEYDYAIIGSADAAAAVVWLTDNGFAVPAGAEAAMQPYADAGLNFVGVRLARPADDLDGSTRPTPLVLSTADDGGELPSYPLGLSALSVERTLPVLIYVLGPQRAAVMGAESTTVSAVADRILDQRYLEYPDAVDALQDDATGPLWVTDAVILEPDDPAITALGPADSRAVLTRLYARLPAAQIGDAQLGWHPDGQAAVNPYQYRSWGNPDEGCIASGTASAPPGCSCCCSVGGGCGADSGGSGAAGGPGGHSGAARRPNAGLGGDTFPAAPRMRILAPLDTATRARRPPRRVP